MNKWLVAMLVIVVGAAVWSFWPPADGGTPSIEPGANGAPPDPNAATGELPGDQAEAGSGAESGDGRTEVEAGPPAPTETVVCGRVIGPSDQPVAGARAEFGGWPANSQRMQEYRLEHGEVQWDNPDSQVTGADGRFEFRFVPPPPFQFSLDLNATECVPLSVRWSELAVGQVVDLGDLRLTAGTRVRGRVVDRDGVPQPNVELYLSHERFDFGDVRPLDPGGATSGQDGRFAFARLAASGAWHVRLRGYELLEPMTLEFAPGQKDAEIEVRIVPPSEVETISGFVVDDTGAPVQGAMILVVPFRRGPRDLVLTKKDGSYRVRRNPKDPEGPVQVRAQKSGYEFGATEKDIEWGARNVRVVLRRGVGVVVTVTRSDTGEPVETFGVRAVPKPGTRSSFSTHDHELRTQGRHEGGVATIRGLERGTYWLSVLVPKGELVQSRFVEFAVTDEGTQRVRVEVAPPVTRTVQVVDVGGQPVAGTRVEWLEPRAEPVTLETFAMRYGDGRMTTGRDWAVVIRDGETDAEGRFELAGHPDAVYALRLLGPGHVPRVVPEVRLAALAEPWRVEVTAGATVTGELRPKILLQQLRQQAGDDETDRPGVRLQRLRGRALETFPFGASARVPFDDQGVYRIAGVPPGDWDLVLAWGSRTLTLNPLPGLKDGEVRTQDLQLDDQVRASLRGRLLVDGEPHRGDVRLVADHGDDSAGNPQRSYHRAQCDAEGRFELLARAGEWRVSVLTPKRMQLFAAERVRVAAGEQKQAEFRIRSREVTLRLLRANGESMPGLKIQLESPDHERPLQLPVGDADGRATVRLAVGDYAAIVPPKRLTDPVLAREFWMEHRDDPAAWRRAMVSLGTVTIRAEDETDVVELTLPDSAGY